MIILPQITATYVESISLLKSVLPQLKGVLEGVLPAQRRAP
jgi:hypothetical protein